MKPIAALLTIGCDNYESLPELPCCEADAHTIKTDLERSDFYQSERSATLESPSLQEIQSFIRTTIPSWKGVDILTVYFSGHGGICKGNFYLCPRDFDSTAPSVTGFSIQQLVRWAADLEVRLLNIVVDACQSGASSLDLREVLEHTGKDNLSGPAVSLLVSSRADQNSQAGSSLSAFTQVFHQVLLGEVDSHVNRKSLTLADIAAVAPKLGSDADKTAQEVVHTAVSVLGLPILCENPLYDGEEDKPQSPLLSPYSILGKSALVHKRTLDHFHENLVNREPFSHLNLVEMVREISTKVAGNQTELTGLLLHYNEWFQGASDPKDWGASFRLSGALLAGSFKALIDNELSLYVLGKEVADSVNEDLRFLADCAGPDFIEKSGILHDMTLDSLFQGPRRLAEIYGRLGLRMLAGKAGMAGDLDTDEMQTVLDALSENLEGHHTILCETQAAGIGLFFYGCVSANRPDLAEQVFGLFCSSYFRSKGRFLRSGASVTQVKDYLVKLSTMKGEILPDFAAKALARPDRILPVFLMNSGSLGLDDTIDWALRAVRGRTASTFETADISSYGDKVMRSGINIQLEVGRDFFKASDYRRELAHRITTNELDATPLHEVTGFAKCVLSLIYKDRFPIRLNTLEGPKTPPGE